MKTKSILLRLVWILGAFAVAVLSGTTLLNSTKRPSPVKTQAALKDLILGVNNYRVEYDNRFPLLKDQDAKVDQRFESTGKFLSVLLGKNEDGNNPREIAYIEPPMGREGKGGLFQDNASGQYKLTDPWGHPYVVLIDGSYDNKIDNPDRKNSSSLVSRNTPATIVAGAVAYSFGPDGVEGTEDDVVSWRSAPSPRPSEQICEISFFFGRLVATFVALLVVIVQGFWLLVDLVSLVRGKAQTPNDHSASPS